jgi:LacI family transcriptional regulator
MEASGAREGQTPEPGHTLPTSASASRTPSYAESGDRRTAGERLDAIGIVERQVFETKAYNWYATPIVEGIIAAGRKLRQDIVQFHGHPSDAIESSLAVYRRQCDGILHFRSELTNEIFCPIRESGFPIVVIGGGRADGDVAFVDIDNIAASRDATAHLIQLGHRRIAILPADIAPTSGERVEGYRRAHSDAGLTPNETMIVASGPTRSSAVEVAQEFLTLPPDRRPTAIVCFNDAVAMGVLRVASDLGIKVPGELSLVGFDDLIEAALARPALTTIRQPLRGIGEAAVGLLLEVIAGTKPAGYGRIMPHELVVRASTSTCSSV